ncbi:hypothetical protein HYDPIDRAFT_112772 [Hydnomerulius pinastri MD-312]|uniref:DUF1275 domain protein n=1 Tax=Hydnomerulius pinastri MD-312 TaxID=994086 RepID=A0A0C9VZE8_9AGAM|nr:hypothetical protein HYDPIDRAFT_112772 [Hydnomerulius pinastri MD-312]
MRRGFAQNSFVSRLHHRTGSLKAQGTPLIPLKGPQLLDVALDSLPENDGGLDDDVLIDNTCGSAANLVRHSDMTTATDDKTTLPAPVVHSKPSHSSIRKDPRDFESDDSSKMINIRRFLMEEIDGAQASAPLSAYCFMTGFVDAVCFSAIFVWCAFQTGNTVQLSLAIVRLFNGQHDYSFHLADQQAFCSVLSFIFGAFIGRLGDKIGCKTRAWMSLGTFIQTVFTMVAALTIWKSGQGSVADARDDPAWSNALSFVCIGFMSASMGLQGIMGKRLNTQFTTTVVLTTTWCELMTEPKLFSFRRLVASRDHKVMAILALFIGGFTGRALLDKIGSAGTLGIGTGFRLLITLWWFFVPQKQAKN